MSELVESDSLLQAFSDEVPEFWPNDTELLATIAETLHSLLLVTMKVNGAKRLPPPLHIPRPGSVKAEPPPPISMSEYVSTVVNRE